MGVWTSPKEGLGVLGEDAWLCSADPAPPGHPIPALPQPLGRRHGEWLAHMGPLPKPSC